MTTAESVTSSHVEEYGSAGALPSRWSPAILAVVRVVVAFMWIENTGWKRPPKFSSLHAYTLDAVNRPVLPPFAWLVRHVVLPNFTFFAWATLLLEASIGTFLLVGLATRLWALIGLVQVLAITFSALNAPHEWEWSYYLMILAHLALWATAAGRYYGLDGLLRPAWAVPDTRLARAWEKIS